MNYFGKRQLMLASLVVALGAAVYINWQLSNKEFPHSGMTQSSKELGEAQFVNNTASEKAQKPEEQNEDTKNEENSEYFINMNKDRQKARDEATEVIKNMLSNAGSSEAVKQEAVKQAAEIAKIIQQEANIESLVKAKGIKECAVFIHNDDCSVVAKGPLDGASAVSIKDIVAGQGGIDHGKIKIIEAD